MSREQPVALVRLDIVDGVATITLNSEHNRNALSRQLVAELADRLSAADNDPGARVVVLRSAHRVFCSGGDLSEASSGAMDESAQRLTDLLAQIVGATKPVVIALTGPVRAGGLGLVGAADVVLAAESVTFALTEVRLGVAPAVISLTLLERMGSRAASELFLSARAFDAREAVEAGLVTRVVADAELDAAVRDVVANILRGSTQGLRETKRLLNASMAARISRDGPEMARLSASLFASDEARQAMAAFLARGT